MKLNEAPDDKLIGTYVKIRDEVAQMEAAHKAALAGPKGKLDKIEAEVLRRLQDRGAESVRTNMGTAYKTTRSSVSVADWDTFFHEFVLPKQAWEMLEHRPSKTAVVQYRGEHNDLPPGLNWSEAYVVGFRRS